MNKKCIGCGALLQTNSSNEKGYIEEENYENSIICKRCFRMKNYGEYKSFVKDEEEYNKLFNSIKSRDNLIIYLCDILSIDDTILKLNEFVGDVILVITKKDLLPKSVKEDKLINYIKDHYKINIKNIIFVSSNKNYNLDKLYNLIDKYKNKKEVYIAGNTNAGKSTLINAFIKAYSNNNFLITTSFVPATTLDLIEIKINDELTLIDTPGLLNNSYILDEDIKTIKKININKEIKPRTYQINPNESLIIENYARIDYKEGEKNSFTLYLSNNIKVDRIKINTNNDLKNLNKTSFNLKNNKDIVINGLCFCKIVKEANVDVYTKQGVNVYERDNLI